MSAVSSPPWVVGGNSRPFRVMCGWPAEPASTSGLHYVIGPYAPFPPELRHIASVEIDAVMADLTAKRFNRIYEMGRSSNLDVDGKRAQLVGEVRDLLDCLPTDEARLSFVFDALSMICKDCGRRKDFESEKCTCMRDE